MRIAIQGCGHGELDLIYAELEKRHESDGKRVDLLIVCGDFQAMRNHFDLASMACPQKYRQLGSFHSYYAGKKKAPVLTIFIGGNHESSAYMWELFYGGWVAENIFYLGCAGVIKVGGLRIAGLSGIYKPNHYYLGHYERPPFQKQDLHSVFHVRSFDIDRMMLIEEPIDIMLSHDWPLGIYHYGDLDLLLKKKPFFREDIEKNCLGSPPLEKILHRLKPDRWFSAHMHVQFEALVKHGSSTHESNEDNEGKSKKTFDSVTRFEALDKCGQRRVFMKIFDIETDHSNFQLEYDKEWLGIVKATNEYISTERQIEKIPQDIDLQTARKWIEDNVKDMTIPSNFSQTAPSTRGDPKYRFTSKEMAEARRAHLNPQTEEFHKLLQMENKFFRNIESIIDKVDKAEYSGVAVEARPIFEKNEEEIQIDDDEFL